MKTKVFFSALCTSILLISNNDCEAQKTMDNAPFSIIKIIENKQNNSISIIWNDSRFDEVEIYNEYGLFMPSMPIFKSKEIHLNDLADGNYFVNFKSQNQIIETKEFKVEQHNYMAKN
jgi:hypothetical protein